MRPRSALSAAALPVAALALAACGSSSPAKIELAPSAGATQAAVPTTPKPPAALRTKPVVQIGASAAGSTANLIRVARSSCSTRRLIKDDVVAGTGRTAAAGQTVTVNYVGVLCATGKQFDSSWQRNQPFTTPLSAGSVINGWVQGIPGMRVGGRRVLIIPPSLGYGKTGSPPTIPPNATLVFVVDLLSVS
jgi:peptidylprolyl isomerase